MTCTVVVPATGFAPSQAALAEDLRHDSKHRASGCAKARAVIMEAHPDNSEYRMRREKHGVEVLRVGTQAPLVTVSLHWQVDGNRNLKAFDIQVVLQVHGAFHWQDNTKF